MGSKREPKPSDSLPFIHQKVEAFQKKWQTWRSVERGVSAVAGFGLAWMARKPTAAFRVAKMVGAGTCFANGLVTPFAILGAEYDHSGLKESLKPSLFTFHKNALLFSRHNEGYYYPSFNVTMKLRGYIGYTHKSVQDKLFFSNLVKSSMDATHHEKRSIDSLIASFERGHQSDHLEHAREALYYLYSMDMNALESLKNTLVIIDLIESDSRLKKRGDELAQVKTRINETISNAFEQDIVRSDIKTKALIESCVDVLDKVRCDEQEAAAAEDCCGL